MPFFKDLSGNERRVRLTGPLIAKVREATGITLGDVSGEGVLRACADGELQTRVLWLLCGDQSPVLTPDAFAESVASGDVFEAARDALHEAVLDFIRPSQRPALQKVLATAKADMEAAQVAVIEQLEGDERRGQLVDALRAGMTAQMDRILIRLRNASDGQVTAVAPLTD